MSIILSWLILASSVAFPNSTNITNDPSGRYQLCWHEATSTDPHRLFIKRMHDSNQQLILEFNRHIDVSWSASGNQFAITDFEGSDSSRVYIFQSAIAKNPIEIRDQLPLSILQSINGNHHSYLAFISWVNENEVLLSATGYGDVGMLDKKVRCIFKKSEWICSDDNSLLNTKGP